MSIIDRYVVRTFLTGWTILILVGMGLYVLADLLLNLDEFTKHPDVPPEAVLANIVDYYACNLSLYFAQLAGPVTAIAAAFTLAVMLKNNELTALISAGMPLQRLAAPIVIAAVGLIALWAVNQELILPKLAHKVVRRRDDPGAARTVGVYCARDDRNHILTALRLYPLEQRLYNVFIIEPGPEGAAGRLVTADYADYDERRRVWVLERGQRVLEGPAPPGSDLPREIRLESVAELPVNLTPRQLVVRQKSEWASLLSVRQMNELIGSGRLANQATIVMARHVRLTQPLLQLVMLALVLPCFLVREPTSVLVAGGMALVVGLTFFGATFAAHSIIRDQAAALIAWLPILLFGPFAVWRLAEVRT